MNVSELLTPGLIRGLIAGAALIVAVLVLRRLLTRAAPEDVHHQKVTCTRCGWSGEVSRYKPRCPKCNEALS